VPDAQNISCVSCSRKMLHVFLRVLHPHAWCTVNLAKIGSSAHSRQDMMVSLKVFKFIDVLLSMQTEFEFEQCGFFMMTYHD